jgi:hypothetical protein
MSQIEDDYHDVEPNPEPPPEPDIEPEEPGAVPEPAEKKVPEVNIIHTREGGFYGPDGNELADDVIKLLWDPEKDTEIPRPRQNGFPDLENQFGGGVDIVKKK